jgi:hypothetical protein
VARRRVNTDYPTPEVVQRTFAREKTSFSGARRFMASQGIVVFAAERTGLARVSGEAWLLPSAVRRLGNYVDMGQTAIAGFTISSDPRVQPMPGTVPETLFDAVCEVAAASKGRVLDGDRQIQLASCLPDEDHGWPWHGTLTYEHTFALDGGERIVSESDIPVMLRATPGGEVELAVIVRRPEDFEVASAWLHAGLAPGRQGWLATPISLSSDAEQRAEELEAIVTGFKVGKLLKVSNPDLDKREATTDEETPSDDRFLEIMRRAQYKTGLTDLGVIAERVVADNGLLSGLTAFLWTREGGASGRRAIVGLRLRQRPGRDIHLELSWHSGRSYSEPQQPTLSDASLEELAALDWDQFAKRRYMLDAFADVATALAAPAAEANAPGESASASQGQTA